MNKEELLYALLAERYAPGVHKPWTAIHRQIRRSERVSPSDDPQAVDDTIDWAINGATPEERRTKLNDAMPIRRNRM
jgi:hypothetical protein